MNKLLTIPTLMVLAFFASGIVAHAEIVSTWYQPFNVSAEQSCNAYNGYLYCFGGVDSTGTPTSMVQYASLASSGQVGSWSASNSLPEPIYIPSCPIYNGYVYCLGGSDGYSGSGSNIVQYAPILLSGDIGSWSQSSNNLIGNVLFGSHHYYIPMSADSCVAYNGYLYCPGGDLNGNPSNIVQYAQILSPGVIGKWSFTKNALAVAVESKSCATYGGYIYCMGGSDPTYSITDVVQYAKIYSSGVIGTWQTTNSLYDGMYDGACVASNGALYCLGGMDVASGGTSNIVQYAQILGSGAAGTWQTTNSMYANMSFQSCTAYNSYIYCPGGYNINGNPSGMVQYTQILTPPTPTLTATPNPYAIDNTIINVGQTSLASTVISGGSAGTTSYSGNWFITPPASSNMVAFSTLTTTLPSSNALTLLITSVSASSTKFTYGGIDYYANAIGTNTAYGAWILSSSVTDSFGDLTPSPALTNIFTVVPAQNTTTGGETLPQCISLCVALYTQRFCS